MKVLLVNGSPHKSGSTGKALEITAKRLKECGIETEIFWIGIDPVSGCRGCRACQKLGKCVVDDCVNEFVEKMKDADGFIFGSSVHYAALTGNMTSFMDRVFYSAAGAGKANYYRFKPAASIVIARRGGCTTAYDQMNRYFGISEMPIISSHYWNMVYGAGPDEIEQDGEGIHTIEALAENMAYYLKCIEAAKAQGITRPRHKPPVWTNFVR